MDLIWLRSAWNAKPAAFSTHPPSSFLPPSFSTSYGVQFVWQHRKRGRKLCERRGDAGEKYKEEEEEGLGCTEKQEDRNGARRGRFSPLLLLPLPHPLRHLCVRVNWSA